MAMQQCPNCGKMISTDARACPSCGKHFHGIAIFGSRVGCGSMVLILIFLVGVTSAIREIIEKEKGASVAAPNGEQSGNQPPGKPLPIPAYNVRYDGLKYAHEAVLKELGSPSVAEFEPAGKAAFGAISEEELEIHGYVITKWKMNRMAKINYIVRMQYRDRAWSFLASHLEEDAGWRAKSRRSPLRQLANPPMY